MEKSKIERIFHYVDKDNTGFLNKYQLKIAYLCLFGYKPSKFELRDIFINYGQHIQQNGVPVFHGVDKVNFIKLIQIRQKYVDWYDKIREIFQCFDTKNKGFISLEDFKRCCLLKYSHMEELKITQYFREIDTNGDGKVSFNDFTIMMET